MSQPLGRRPSATVYLALGTNLGDRLANLRAVPVALPAYLCLFACSPIYETEPWGYSHQPAFLNQVIAGKTRLQPVTLLNRLKRLETKLRRKPTFPNGPRLIDIDILFYDDLILDTPRLTLPHPRLHERAFVLTPLADIAPYLLHPRLNKTVGELLAATDRSGVKFFSYLNIESIPPPNKVR